MRGLLFRTLLLCSWLAGVSVFGATGKIIKVLPHFLDEQGRNSLAPSLYERDAYQAWLRDHPDKRVALRFDIQWKDKAPVWEALKLRLELRGIAGGELPKELTIEQEVAPCAHFSKWSPVLLAGEQYKEFGDVTAWRATLWEGDTLLSEQKSFLW